MFESAELGQKVEKRAWARRVPPLRKALLDTQADVLAASQFPVVVLVSGVDGAGKGETVNLLNEWLDPRHVVTRAMGVPEGPERRMPSMWRYWQALPPKGRIGMLFGSWYTSPIVERVYRNIRKPELQHEVDEILKLEELLAADGACIVKLWFHLSKKAQHHRLKALESDRDTRWRVTATDWKHFELYDEFRAVSEDVLRQTSTTSAPWSVIEATDAHYRNLTAATVLIDAMRGRLALKESEPGLQSSSTRPRPVSGGSAAVTGVVSALDLTPTLTKKKYDEELDHWRGKLNLLSRHPRFAKRSVVLAFEGSDAAGKGGVIRRITGALDARRYHVVPIAAPSEEERAYPYLWRFWRHVPARNNFAIFDRSWYGRVLVERVEKLCAPERWQRGYQEICDFEDQLSSNGAIVVKVWLAVSKEEQLRRFHEREKTRWKRFKLTSDDWRNRDKWHAYQTAANEMVERTSTPTAPWTLVAANDKGYARIKVLKTLCARIEEEL